MSTQFITVTERGALRILNVSCIRDIWDAEEDPNDKETHHSVIYLKPLHTDEKEDSDICGIRVSETMEELSRMLQSVRVGHVNDEPIKML